MFGCFGAAVIGVGILAVVPGTAGSAAHAADSSLVACVLSGTVGFAPALTGVGGGSGASTINARLKNCVLTNVNATIRSGHLTGSFSSSPFVCGSPSTTGAPLTARVTWSGSVGKRGRIGSTTVHGNTASGSFAGPVTLTLNAPPALASGCASGHKLMGARIDGAITFDAGGVVCAASGPITIYAIDPGGLCKTVAQVVSPSMYEPSEITTGSDGALWFVAEAGPSPHEGAIARITTAGDTTIYPTVPLEGGGVAGDSIASGPDGALWYLPECFPDIGAGCIGRMTTDGSATSYPLPAGDVPISLTSGPSGALWFTFLSSSANGIGEITTSGEVTTFSDPRFGAWNPTSSSQLRDITTGPDGDLWFLIHRDAVLDPCSIGSMTTTGVVHDYAVPSCPSSLTSGPGGEIWFANAETGSPTSVPTLAAMSTSGILTASYPLSSTPWSLLHMRLGPDGAFWFSDPGFIGRIEVNGTVTTYTNPYMDDAGGVAVGPDGAIWFTDLGNDTIGRITTP